MQIEGHADDRGPPEHNTRLSEGRAEAVAQRLRELGIAPERLTTVARGKRQPLANCADDICAAQNRRVVTALSGTRPLPETPSAATSQAAPDAAAGPPLRASMMRR